MHVIIKTLAGGSFSVATSSAASAATLLAGAVAAIGDGIDTTSASLVFLGRVLDDADVLGAAGVREGSVLILARCRTHRSIGAVPVAADGRGAALVTLSVKRVGTEAEATSVTVSRSAALHSVIQRLRSEWGVGAVRLVHGGRMLHPDAMVSEVGLSDGMMVFGMVSAAAVAPAAADTATAALSGYDSNDEQPDEQPDGTQQHENDVVACRICHCAEEMSAELGPLFSPCLCSGTMQLVHVECLNRWRRMSSNPTSYFACDSCGYRYQMNRTRWAGYVESRAATEIATALMCALLVCSAALPCYWLAVHEHFVRIPRALLHYWLLACWLADDALQFPLTGCHACVCVGASIPSAR
jgi:hypothetical protein